MSTRPRQPVDVTMTNGRAVRVAATLEIAGYLQTDRGG
jgi:hypothetical protein